MTARTRPVRRGRAVSKVCLGNKLLKSGIYVLMSHEPHVNGSTVGQRIGYTRVSTVSQTLDQQNGALEASGATKTFSDSLSGARDDRPGLAALMEYVREGDTVVVWKLDRLGRNTLQILETVKTLTDRGVTLISVTDGIDSSCRREVDPRTRRGRGGYSPPTRHRWTASPASVEISSPGCMATWPRAMPCARDSGKQGSVTVKVLPAPKPSLCATIWPP